MRFDVRTEMERCQGMWRWEFNFGTMPLPFRCMAWVPLCVAGTCFLHIIFITCGFQVKCRTACWVTKHRTSLSSVRSLSFSFAQVSAIVRENSWWSMDVTLYHPVRTNIWSHLKFSRFGEGWFHEVGRSEKAGFLLCQEGKAFSLQLPALV